MTLDVGIVGATGIVGEVLLRLLEERSFPVGELRLFATERSAGRKIPWGGGEVTVEVASEGRFRGLDVVMTSIGSGPARDAVPRIAAEGPVVIDNSSAFRMDPEVPLVVPEINPAALQGHQGIVANPNCTALVALMAVAPLHRAVGIRSMITSSYQSVSGTGRGAVDELFEQTAKALDQTEALKGDQDLDLPEPRIYPHHAAFNVFPQAETFPEHEDTTTEEAKMQAESRKILEDPKLVVHATAVRVPVVVGHSVAVSLSLDREVGPEEARELIGGFHGVQVVDRPERGEYPTPLAATGRDDVLVGRIRRNPVLPNGLSLFAAGDNLRKGAALNVIQIAETLFG